MIAASDAKRGETVKALVVLRPSHAGQVTEADIVGFIDKIGMTEVLFTNLEFLHGVASGDPLADRVILWTRVSGPASGRVAVNYAVYADPQLTQAVTAGSAETDETRDYTVKVDAAGLQPATTYYYQFESGGVKSAVGRTRTLPVGSVEISRAS